MKLVRMSLLLAGILLFQHLSWAQPGINRLRRNLENKVDQAIFGTKKTSSSSDDSENRTSERARNKGGEGLVTTPPNVPDNLGEAEKAYKSGSYGEARYAVRQAMLGVEMEIGQQILKSLPETVSGLNTDASADQVSSAGWGWTGLTIQRRYTDKKDKELNVVIANNSVMLSAVNMYLTNGTYAQQSGGEQNWKQTKVKNHRAVIEYDDSSGYKLSVPLGQSTIVVYEGVNFKNEAEMVAAAGTLDLDNIKKMLGEQ
jgi:hypothetical protein